MSIRTRGRGNPRGKSRGGRHQNHFVESSAKVPQEPATDYLFMASHNDIYASQCVWYIDSGAIKHMTGKQEVFSKLAPCNNEVISLGDASIHEVQGKDVLLFSQVNVILQITLYRSTER